jgi:hypothetical protein
MDIEGLKERQAKKFDQHHLKHANDLNIKILRTTTLMELMLAEEGKSNCGKRLLELCSAGKPIVMVTRTPGIET